ncbi:MAG: SH3 domain-containing protein [Chloroflexi bacterium]|nr:SH3 domain-containing protein [Chloroflexota bacterium]
MKPKRAFLWLFILMATAACNYPVSKSTPQPTAYPPPSTQPAPATGTTLAPTAIPTSLPTPTLTPAPQVFTPFKSSVWADHTNVRANPGYLFQVVLNVLKGTSFTVLGQSPGGEWIYVETASGSRGWIYAQLFEPGVELQAAPVVQPENTQLVKGRVVDGSGNPVSAIQFTLLQGAGEKQLRNDAVTDAQGEFYAFMPADASGEWSVSYTGIGCASNVMDASCNCKEDACGTVNPPQVTVTLPPSETLEFTWR